MDNTEYLKQLADQEKKNKQIELEQTKAAALKSIEQQKAQTMPQFTAQKQQANVQSQLGAKNLAEFWANRGQTQQGISQQAELSRQNALAGTLSGITQNEAAAQQEFGNQMGEVQTNYQNQLTNYTNQADLQLQQNLYADKIAQQQAQAEAQQRAEDIAREQAQQEFENQLALAKYNLSVSNSVGASKSKTPLTKQGNYKNTVIDYTGKNDIRASVVNGDNITYTLTNGSTLTLPLFTNPYTGGINSDAQYGTFNNGYQPNNYKGQKLTNTGAVVTNTKTGETVRVWTPDNSNFYFWDTTKNNYNKLTTNEAKALKLISSTKSTGGTGSYGAPSSTGARLGGFR